MKKILLLLFSVLLLFANPLPLKANHIVGAYFNYEFLSGNQYLVKLMLFRDCSGITAPANVAVCYHSDSCSFNAIITLTITTNVTAVPSCPYVPSVVTTCQGGVGFGLEMYTYVGVLTLPFTCSDWTLSYSAHQIGGPGPGFIYPNFMVSTKINNLNFANNNSPDIIHTPIFEYCIGQLGYDDLSATDSDGDSLYYELIPTATDSFICPPQPMPAAPGTGLTQPLSSTPYYMDSIGGWLNFTPLMVQIGHLTVRVSEYRLGQLINETLISHLASCIGNCVVTNLETHSESNISIFPNPVNEEFQMTGIDAENYPLQIEIFSPDGRLVKSISVNETNAFISVKELPPAVYQVRIKKNNMAQVIVPVFKNSTN